MLDTHLILLIVAIGTGLLLIGLSIPLIRGRVPPNPWYGFRVPRTLKNPAVWYPANAYSAKGMLWVGIATIAATLLPFCMPGVEPGNQVLGVIIVLVVGVFSTVVASFLYLRRLDDDGNLE